MIIGNGDIASVLKDRDGFLFFASGVSNSKEMDEQKFEREIKLLESMRIYSDKHLVYFSSLAVFNTNTRYVQHKFFMENLVRTFPHYTIVRIGNITWGKNPNTLINYLRATALAGKKLEIQDVYRYIVDKEEFLYWVDLIPDWNCEMNIPGERMKVIDVVHKYVDPFIINLK